MHNHTISVNDGLLALHLEMPYMLHEGSVLLVHPYGYFVHITEVLEFDILTGEIQCSGVSDSTLHHEISTGIALN